MLPLPPASLHSSLARSLADSLTRSGFRAHALSLCLFFSLSLFYLSLSLSLATPLSLSFSICLSVYLYLSSHLSTYTYQYVGVHVSIHIYIYIYMLQGHSRTTPTPRTRKQTRACPQCQSLIYGLAAGLSSHEDLNPHIANSKVIYAVYSGHHRDLWFLRVYINLQV